MAHDEVQLEVELICLRSFIHSFYYLFHSILPGRIVELSCARGWFLLKHLPVPSLLPSSTLITFWKQDLSTSLWVLSLTLTLGQSVSFPGCNITQVSSIPSLLHTPASLFDSSASLLNSPASLFDSSASFRIISPSLLAPYLLFHHSRRMDNSPSQGWTQKRTLPLSLWIHTTHQLWRLFIHYHISSHIDSVHVWNDRCSSHE